MLGAIIGDLIGSVYEYPEFQDMVNKTVNIERRLSVFEQTPEELLNPECFFSDDTVLTVAIADSIVNNCSYEQKLREYGQRYQNLNKGRPNYFDGSFSANFMQWLNDCTNGHSYGNGAAMRVSPVGYLFEDLESVQIEAMKTALPSHNSKEAVNGAKALASTIMLARKGFDKTEIKSYVSNTFEYNLDLDLETLQKTNRFNPTCKVTVPQAIFVFLESTGFEDAMKKSLSIGGDTDTIACMVGGIAEGYYGIPDVFVKDLVEYDIPEEFFEILDMAYNTKMQKENF